MPALEEGNLWVRATMPVDISFDQAARLTNDVRRLFRESPEVTTVVSQLGRPDDGTDPTSFSNAEFLANLKPADGMAPRVSKEFDRRDRCAAERPFPESPSIFLRSFRTMSKKRCRG